ncbi:hypothetical protein ANN_04180 [Periplaneta americana]|uniref:Uncharacterized protein n=1 Tax=Periplaneta americana TaxID=6978 RepID=A0ABQ8T9W2_PERAM|nr:hypothetical protein ANN_04180 [Periplaneta americana]
MLYSDFATVLVSTWKDSSLPYSRQKADIQSSESVDKNRYTMAAQVSGSDSVKNKSESVRYWGLENGNREDIQAIRNEMLQHAKRSFREG